MQKTMATIVAAVIATLLLGNSNLSAQMYGQGVVTNPYFEAEQRRIAAKKRRITEKKRESVRVNADLDELREFVLKSGSNKMQSGNGDAPIQKDDAQIKDFRRLIRTINKDGADSWLPRLSKPNKEYVAGGSLISEATPLLDKLSRQAAYEEAKRKLKLADEKAMDARSRYQKTPVTYDNYRYERDPYRREQFRQKAIADLINDRDLKSMDEKLRKLGF